MTLQPLPNFSSRRSPYKIWLILFVLAIALASAIPNYLTGNWSLSRVPKLSNVPQLQRLQKSGLSLPGWQTLNQKTIEIGGHKWSTQAIVPQSSPTDPAILLMLRPQTWHRDLPQVDWMDVRGGRNWTEEEERSIRFSVAVEPESAAASPTLVNARFLRGWTADKTYAALQWYAWKDGGHSAPSQWFWAEQFSQLRDRQHLPWVAVSLLLPMPPLSELEAIQPQAEALGQLIQSRLATEVFP
ncbi:MAG: cyanoexosortase B system-associated protein [Oscillatoriophycideae cyanobacterium NC_groundwater_1537_Pr4_S-0.65um_50_18]|nr:cyanoexosortase B system-associated protein [Oscillatoriophycideae cyanobacterium NC_groundwater_1537_Pr4_S-0.65um_50_18]